MRPTALCCLTALLFATITHAQQDLPKTQVYLLKMEKADTNILFKAPKLLTAFNAEGYNNQPCFTNNEELLLTVGKPGDNQTDIYLMDLRRNTLLRLTRTPESEYSPKPAPNNLYFSVVRVETDGERTQRLWQYPLDRKDKGKPIFRYLRAIGYYHWVDAFHLALFNIGEVNYLSLGDTRTDETRHLAPGVGRCFGTSPTGRLVFVHKITDNNWALKAMDPNSLEVEKIADTIPGSEDFVILPDGSVLMGKGSRLFVMHPPQDMRWKEIADLKKIGITNITRLAASADGKLAIVNGG